MKYISVAEFSKKWNIPERTVRNYCAHGRINGSFLTGKTYNIPEDALPPSKESKKKFSKNPLLNKLKEEKEMKLKGGIYHRTQIDLTYNSNRIEGSRLTLDQTRYIFETNTVGVSKESINVDDIIETTNHFRAIDLIIDKAKSKLTESLIKELHFLLKSGTSDSAKDWFNVGEYKKLPNEVGGNETTAPGKVATRMKEILSEYNDIENKTIEDIIAFHYQFEIIHPFQDGNGRVGRLIMFKECLANNVIPFIIDEELKLFYYRGLQEWENIRGYLLDTCLTAQDNYNAILKYFEIQE
ncbi:MULTISPECIES: Fic family protein [Chryseobacterium group]|uniref:Cell division protein Fic n=3 Tax=Chryseobacterium group TaxID=2782232 RepID=A0A085B5T4_9FLAO|nr:MULTISPECIES: Fic family protein [Chryseobacterium group]AZA89804.1 Fic family protein [Chryseobacterium nakagawai]KFC17829.1 cell division protein Fic [Epilithonimonas lactis]SEQ76985.1 Fic/DOC family protein [Epilithonimonas lactis]SER13785.1 Fic/DOC family protein [Epilithonimonas lactis]SMP11989.1 Fic/DOC family protein [Chryseobacterium profundimaris]